MSVRANRCTALVVAVVLTAASVLLSAVMAAKAQAAGWKNPVDKQPFTHSNTWDWWKVYHTPVFNKCQVHARTSAYYDSGSKQLTAIDVKAYNHDCKVGPDAKVRDVYVEVRTAGGKRKARFEDHTKNGARTYFGFGRNVKVQKGDVVVYTIVWKVSSYPKVADTVKISVREPIVGPR